MKIAKLAGVAATVVTLGLAGVNAAPAWATDSVRVFGQQETLNGPNGLPYIGYAVGKLAPSSDAVPHNGTLYAAKLVVDGFGGGYPPSIERFGARAESGSFYPSIWGASNAGKLYFDVVGDIPEEGLRSAVSTAVVESNNSHRVRDGPGSYRCHHVRGAIKVEDVETCRAGPGSCRGTFRCCCCRVVAECLVVPGVDCTGCRVDRCRVGRVEPNLKVCTLG